MAIHTHFVAASARKEPFYLEKLQSFLKELLHEDIVRMPVAIFVGDAQNDPKGLPWSSEYASHFIVPNSPGSMLELGEDDDFPAETIWYYGEDKEDFFAHLCPVPGKIDSERSKPERDQRHGRETQTVRPRI